MKKVFEYVYRWYHNIVKNTRWFLAGLKRWFSYFRVSFRIYDFDYTSILEIERHQLERVKNSLVNRRKYIDWDRSAKEIELAIKLLDIVLHESEDIIFIGKSVDIDENGKLSLDPNSKWLYPHNVNTNNASRFVSPMMISKFNDPKIGELMKEDLRETKAWYLYNKIKYRYLRSWWD